MPIIIVDGYNVIRKLNRFMRAEASSLEDGRISLLMELEELGASSSNSITAVFDGAGYPNWDEPTAPDSFAGVDIIFSRKGRSADDVIVEMIERHRGEVSSDGSSSDIVVITDDGMLRSDVVSRGAFVISTKIFDEVLRGVRQLSY